VSAAAALVLSVNTWVVGLIVRGHIPALCILVDARWYSSRVPRRCARTQASLTGTGLALTPSGLYEIRYTYLSLISLVVLLIVEAIAQPKKTLTSNTLRTAGFVLPPSWPGAFIGSSQHVHRALPAPGFGSPVAYARSMRRWISCTASLCSTVLSPHAVKRWLFRLSGRMAVHRLGLLVATVFRRNSAPDVRAVALLWGFGVVYASGSVGFFGGFNNGSSCTYLG